MYHGDCSSVDPLLGHCSGSNCTACVTSPAGVLPSQVNYESCSEAVGEAMAADNMKSVQPLVADILHHLPLLLYQVRPATCHDIRTCNVMKFDQKYYSSHDTDGTVRLSLCSVDRQPTCQPENTFRCFYLNENRCMYLLYIHLYVYARQASGDCIKHLHALPSLGMP